MTFCLENCTLLLISPLCLVLFEYTSVWHLVVQRTPCDLSLSVCSTYILLDQVNLNCINHLMNIQYITMAFLSIQHPFCAASMLTILTTDFKSSQILFLEPLFQWLTFSLFGSISHCTSIFWLPNYRFWIIWIQIMLGNSNFHIRAPKYHNGIQLLAFSFSPRDNLNMFLLIM